jgi:hypothetical protein
MILFYDIITLSGVAMSANFLFKTPQLTHRLASATPDKLRLVAGFCIGDTMKEIPLTHGKVAIVDDEDFEKIKNIHWTYRSCPTSAYALGCFEGKMVFMHRMIVDVDANMQIDHISGNGLDNRKENLRLATPQQNTWNRSVSKRNKTGFKGIWKERTKYSAGICINKLKIRLGRYKKPEDAARAYDKAAKYFFGSFARLNFPN